MSKVTMAAPRYGSDKDPWRKYHVATREGTAACNPYGLLLEDRDAHHVSKIAPLDRCMRSGCRQRWLPE